VDETGLSGRYDLEIPISSLEAARVALRERYGLSLNSDEREIECLSIQAESEEVAP